MNYTKVFNNSRFSTKAQPNLNIDTRRRRIVIGQRGSNDGPVAFIGKILEQGKITNLLDFDVYCDISFPHVIGIFGSRGSGKSFDLGVFLEGIFLRDNLTSAGEVTDAAIVFDIQDQYWTLAHPPRSELNTDEAQLSDLQKWGLSAAAVGELSIFVPAGSDTQVPNAKQFVLSPGQLSPDDWLSLLELERFSPMGQAMLSLLSAEGSHPPGEFASRIGNGSLRAFQQGTIDGLRWRLESLSHSAVIGVGGISIDALLEPRHLSVILMRNLSEALRGLIVGVISRLAADRMGRVQQGRKVEMRTGQRSADGGDIAGRLWLVLDEAHVLVPSDSSTAATAPLIDYVKRGRDAGLSLIFATQQPSAVDSKLMSQVDLTLTHMLGFEADLSAATARMPTRTSIEYDVDNQRVSSISDLIRSLGPGEAIVADGASSRVFVVKIRPRVTAHGGVTPK